MANVRYTGVVLQLRFSKHLRKFMAEMGYTNASLAKAMDYALSSQQISNLCCAKGFTSLKTIADLCNLLHKDPEDFFVPYEDETEDTQLPSSAV